MPEFAFRNKRNDPIHCPQIVAPIKTSMGAWVHGCTLSSVAHRPHCTCSDVIRWQAAACRIFEFPSLFSSYSLPRSARKINFSHSANCIFVPFRLIRGAGAGCPASLGLVIKIWNGKRAMRMARNPLKQHFFPFSVTICSWHSRRLPKKWRNICHKTLWCTKLVLQHWNPVGPPFPAFLLPIDFVATLTRFIRIPEGWD